MRAMGAALRIAMPLYHSVLAGELHGGRRCSSNDCHVVATVSK